MLMALASHYECETFLDVGANIGAYALLMSTVPTVKSIHAFEPSPDTFAELRANVARNNADVQIHNKAVSYRRGVLQFVIVNTLSGANSFINTSMHSRFEKRIDVEAIKIDEVLVEEGRRVCIKIDVEGHEPAALAGMARYLSRNDVLLQIEDYTKSGELQAILEPHGFGRLFRIGPDTYFSNIQPLPSDRECVEFFEAAAERLVATNLAALESLYSQGPSPVTVSLGRTIKVQMGGRLATLSRYLYKKLRSFVE